MDEYEQNRWRKRPVEITARRMREPFEVETMEGVMRGKAGDWLITGVRGEQYPCDDEIFRATYEVASNSKGPPREVWVRVTDGAFGHEIVDLEVVVRRNEDFLHFSFAGRMPRDEEWA